ncbi:cell division protein ZapE [Oceanisphaera pacifica]|uniref:AFG1 family ATPase n=1 Tax=Oceanisphaera pacifica TaxID=2818389 RepID=A0ABS3NF99_9GAMM|nr:cell division protein ZapE [Oceanisphaera pacifica]MBO1518956.1 AFG1 family ATPase [Oceanisphaera pacifica]
MSENSPYFAYQQALHAGFKEEASQRAAVTHLEHCYQQLKAGNTKISGVYLWGPVGRGKTWLMDCFYRSLTTELAINSQRMHFHHFMRWVHQRLFQLTGQADPLLLLAQELASKTQVLCLDELFISDIGDVMLLSRLLQQLFEQGLILVVTSNQPPEKLYENGFNRERLLPAIDAINRHMQVLSMNGKEDHRLHPGQPVCRFWVNDPQSLASAFSALAANSAHKQTLLLGHKNIRVIQRTEQMLWCRYTDLCEQPLAASDFIELCNSFSSIFLSEVPKLTGSDQQKAIARGTEDGVTQVIAGDRELPALSRQDDGVRRFIALVDECYDRKIPLYLSAEVPLHELYTQGALAFPFRRTLSRLQEMQLQRFGQ